MFIVDEVAVRALEREKEWQSVKKVHISTTTGRDGEQCPGASMLPRQKLEVARQEGTRLKADVIEAGYPVISKDDFEAVRLIATEVKGPIIAALARCVDEDIDAAVGALKPAGDKARVHVFIGTSPIHRANLGKGKTQDEVLALAVAAVNRAKSHVHDVQFSPMDATRTERDFLLEMCKAVIAAGATVINIPDTVGRAMPSEMAELVSFLFSEIPELRGGEVILSVHCHNDLGRAVDNSLAAVMAGARQVECTTNGIGERAGNAALEEIVMNLKVRSDYFGGLYTTVNTREILKTSRLVARMTGLAVQRSKAIVGENAFAHASGIHQDGMLKNRESFEIMNPTEVGWGATELPLTKHSGRAALSARLKQLGFNMGPGDVSAIFAQFKEIGDKKKFVYDDDLVALVEGRITEVPETWSLEYLAVTTQTGGIPTATVRLKNCKEEPQDAGTGDGPVDAVLKTIDRLTNTKGKLLHYVVGSVSQGKDAIGEVLVEVDFGKGAIVKGKAAHTDVIEASARAYLNAVNRHMQMQKGK